MQREAEAALKPATERDFAVAMDRLLEFAALYEIAAVETAKLVAQYRRALADLPADVLVDAIDATLRGWTYRKLPLPGDIQRHANDEMARRRRLKIRAKQAEIASWNRPQPDPEGPAYRDLPPERQAEVDRMIADTKAKFLTW